MKTAVSFFLLLAYSIAALGKNIEIRIDFDDAMKLLNRPRQVRPVVYSPTNEIPPYARAAMMPNFPQFKPVDPYGYLQNVPDVVRQLEMNEKHPELQLANELKDISNTLAASKNLSELQRQYASGLEDLKQKGFDLHLVNREPIDIDDIQLNKEPIDVDDMQLNKELINGYHTHLNRKPISRDNIQLNKKPINVDDIQLNKEPFNGYNILLNKEPINRDHIQLKKESINVDGMQLNKELIKRDRKQLNKKLIKGDHIQLNKEPFSKKNKQLNKEPINGDNKQLNKEPINGYNILLNKEPISRDNIHLNTKPELEEDDLVYASLEEALPIQEKDLKEKIKRVIRGKRLRRKSNVQISLEKVKTSNHDTISSKQPNNTERNAIVN